jgi:hypothetical protein
VRENSTDKKPENRNCFLVSKCQIL